MRHLHNEDLELQIKLAELQSDVQMNLTGCFASFAGLLTSVLVYLQLYIQSEVFLHKAVILIAMWIFGVVFVIPLNRFLRRALVARKQIEELRKKYVW